MIRAEQIFKPVILPVNLINVAVAAASNSVAITAALTSTLAALAKPVALAVAGPVTNPQSAAPSYEGVITTGLNEVNVKNTSTKSDYVTPQGQAVYARVTQASGVYTASFFTNAGGTESAYTFASATAIDLAVEYQFSFGNAPFVLPGGMYMDPSQVGTTQFTDVLTVTGTNTLSAPSNAPNVAKSMSLAVNDVNYSNVGATPYFTIVSGQPTWSAANAGFNLIASDLVRFSYSL